MVFNILLVHLLAALVALDLVSTLWGLHRGLVERNPILRSMFGIAGAAPTMCFTHGTLIVIVETLGRRASALVLAPLIALYLWVVVGNFRRAWRVGA